jgi:hypothetical protein
MPPFRIAAYFAFQPAPIAATIKAINALHGVTLTVIAAAYQTRLKRLKELVTLPSIAQRTALLTR